MNSMRILHAPSNIANQAVAAAQGLRALGQDVEVWHYGPNPYGFQTDRTIDIGGRPDHAMAVFREALERDFDVFHFHFARSLVPAVGGLPWFWDLPVLRALGKRILFTFHGSDVRKRSVHLHEDPWSYFRFSDVPCDETRIDKTLAIIRSYAQALIVASPLNLGFVPGAHYVPKVVQTDRFAYVGPRRERRPLVVHVPSKRATKGTEFVTRGFEALERLGHAFDHRIVEGLPHDELRATFEGADVVVDNLLLGDCEVSSLEAMALGKPVVTRIREEVRAAHPDLPAVHADPDTFVDAMVPLLTDPTVRRYLGERGRAYVEADHSPAVVATKLMGFYEAAPPYGPAAPDWTGVESLRMRESLERRIQAADVSIADRKRMLSEEDDLLRGLRGRYGGRRPITVLREMRRLRARRR